MDYPGFSLLLNRSMPKEIKPSVRAVVRRGDFANKGALTTSSGAKGPSNAFGTAITSIGIAAEVSHE